MCSSYKFLKGNGSVLAPIYASNVYDSNSRVYSPNNEPYKLAGTNYTSGGGNNPPLWFKQNIGGNGTGTGLTYRMISKNYSRDLGAGYNDCIYVNAYESDVKGSSMLMFSKSGAGRIGFAYSNTSGDENWQTQEIYHTGHKPTYEDTGAMKRGTYERIEGATKNLNDYNLAGMYNYKGTGSSAVLNRPDNQDGVLLVLPWDSSTYSTQMAISRSATGNEIMYIRHCEGGTWRAWRRYLASDDIVAGDNISLSTQADGKVRVSASGGGSPAAPYKALIGVSLAWVPVPGGGFSCTLIADTHGKGTDPQVEMFVNNIRHYDEYKLATNGDITFYSNSASTLLTVKIR